MIRQALQNHGIFSTLHIPTLEVGSSSRAEPGDAPRARGTPPESYVHVLETSALTQLEGPLSRLVIIHRLGGLRCGGLPP